MISAPRFVQSLPAAASLALALPAASPPLQNHSAARLQDGARQSPCQCKAIPVVNAASFSGFAGQHEGRVSVYDKYLIHHDGGRVESHSRQTAPEGRAPVAHIERWLAEKP